MDSANEFVTGEVDGEALQGHRRRSSPAARRTPSTTRRSPASASRAASSASARAPASSSSSPCRRGWPIACVTAIAAGRVRTDDLDLRTHRQARRPDRPAPLRPAAPDRRPGWPSRRGVVGAYLRRLPRRRRGLTRARRAMGARPFVPWGPFLHLGGELLDTSVGVCDAARARNRSPGSRCRSGPSARGGHSDRPLARRGWAEETGCLEHDCSAAPMITAGSGPADELRPEIPAGVAPGGAPVPRGIKVRQQVGSARLFLPALAAFVATFWIGGLDAPAAALAVGFAFVTWVVARLLRDFPYPLPTAAGLADRRRPAAGDRRRDRRRRAGRHRRQQPSRRRRRSSRRSLTGAVAVAVEIVGAMADLRPADANRGARLRRLRTGHPPRARRDRRQARDRGDRLAQPRRQPRARQLRSAGRDAQPRPGRDHRARDRPAGPRARAPAPRARAATSTTRSRPAASTSRSG